VPEFDHIPVLPAETLAALRPAPGETYADATAGLGGHAALMAPALGPSGIIILNDVDPANLDRARARVTSTPGGPSTVHTTAGNFADLPRRIADLGRPADLLLADLGFSSNQMSDPARGFSFMRDGPLDMRLDPSLRTSAADLVNTLPERELARILRDLGEEPASNAIAKRIVLERKSSPITSTAQFADIVRSAVGRRGTDRIDPSTRSFQALRIAVNDELGVLDALLTRIADEARALSSGQPGRWLRPGARVAVISFHSLEDRPVKQAMARWVGEGWAEFITNGAIAPSETKVRENPRARSAKLRAVRLGRVTDAQRFV